MALDWGAEVAIDPSSDDPVSAIKDLSHGEGADKTFDCTSSIDARRDSINPHMGNILHGWCWWRSTSTDERPNFPSTEYHRALDFSKVLLSDYARFIADRNINLDDIFTHEWSIADAEKAYELFDNGKTGKGVLPLDI